MHLTSSILGKLKQDYPQFKFEPGQKFMWSPDQQTVFYIDELNQPIDMLLHELAHALLGHQNYKRDVELLAKEAEAWNKTNELANLVGAEPNEDLQQECLNGYRDWLYKRSLCPECGASGVQTEKSIYNCPGCNCKWKVNDARNCELRRYNLKNKDYTPKV